MTPVGPRYRAEDDLQAGCNLDLPDRERSREEERESLGTGHGAVCARKKQLPKAALCIACARRLLQEQLPRSCARPLACEAQ